jgi:signal transduction histidine kinase
MRRLAVYLALVLPVIGLGLWLVFPQADPSLAAPLLHFYIVSFTTFAATVVSLFVAISAGQTALPRHLLLAVAFAWMGAVFFIHGITTPQAIITQFHSALQWSAWLTLFGGAAIFVAGAFAPHSPDPRFLRVTAAVILAVYLVYVAAAVFAEGVLSSLLRASPPIAAALAFGLTLLMWLISAIQHFRHYGETHNFVDGLMAFESGWFAAASVSLFGDPVFDVFPLWNASWWLYHALLLAGFLIAIRALWLAYEQVRAFRLTRYFAAASLIVTAGLALLSAHLYSQQVYRSLLDQIETGAGAISRNVADRIAADLPEVASADDLRQLEQTGGLRERVNGQLAGQEILQQVNLYDAEGRVVYSTEDEWIGVSLKGAPGFADFQASLAGAAIFKLHAPGAPLATYAPTNDLHVLETYVPFRPGGELTADPIGVLTTVREAPELGEALVGSRRAGIGLAALSMGGLFLALLAIVRRADQILSSRARELERAYADLRQAESLRDDLTNMIVHDLRNPLTAITANLDLISKTANNPEYAGAAQRFLGGARAAGQRMTSMIEDLLNVSKFEAGELRPALAPVYFPTLLVEKADGYRTQAEKENKSITLHAPPDLPTVLADGELIGRVIDNLVSNAFKYTERGGHIEILVERQNPSLIVRVRDNGQGIPPEYHQRVFQKFVQVTDQNGAPLRKGTGLGLAFCRLAVEAHGGQIWVESAVGRGSTFSFALPLNQ